MKAKELANKYVPELIEAHTKNEEAINEVIKIILRDFHNQLTDLTMKRLGLKNKDGTSRHNIILEKARMNTLQSNDVFIAVRKEIIQKYRAFVRHTNKQFRNNYDFLTNENILKEDGLEILFKNME